LIANLLVISQVKQVMKQTNMRETQ